METMIVKSIEQWAKSYGNGQELTKKELLQLVEKWIKKIDLPYILVSEKGGQLLTAEQFGDIMYFEIQEKISNANKKILYDKKETNESELF